MSNQSNPTINPGAAGAVATSPTPSDATPSGGAPSSEANGPSAAGARDRAERQLHLGHQRVKSAINALQPTELLLINVDVPSSVQTALGCWPEVEVFLPQLAALAAVGFRYQQVEQLVDCALALGHTHHAFVTAGSGADASAVQALLRGRSRLYAHGMALVAEGLIAEDRVAVHRSGLSHRDLGYDVIGLAGLFLDNWDKFGSVVNLKQAEVEELRLRANELLYELGLKDQGPGANAALSLERQKAFTLFMRCYTETRHGIQFLRRDYGDADTIIPSLHTRPKRRRAGGDVGDGSAVGDDTLGDEPDRVDDAAIFDAALRNAEPRAAASSAARVAASGPGAELPMPAVPFGMPGSPPVFEGEE